METVLTALLNTLAQPTTNICLVLDDYHQIDAPVIHQSLSFLLEHMPPRLHVIIASRTDPPLPLARLRARGELTELRAADLRFTLDETATFLREVMALALRPVDIAALERRTEGWIAGLHLVALALHDRADV
jgi:LuxR family maltose regulon positive regulatory protein